jgi:signal transduction histidine kinase
MRDALSSAANRAGWRLDALMALVIGAMGAGELLAATGRERTMAAAFAVALTASCLAVLMRRRYPLAGALLLAAAWFLPGVVVGAGWADASPETPVLAIVVLAYTLGAREQRTRGLIGLGLLVLALSGGDFADPVPPFMFTVPAWIAGEAVQARNRLAAQLAARARELDEEREAFAREAVRYERTRIARELHDIVAHSLSMMVVQAGAGQRHLTSNPAEAARSLEHVGGAARQAELELGRLLELLSDDSPRRSDGGVRLIEELVRRAGASGLSVSCRFNGAHDELPPDLSDTAYRVAQEGLTNALKHAPGAPVRLSVDASELALVVTVENERPQGVATELQSAGGRHGIHGMRERVQDCGGMLEAGPTASDGWRVTARLPLPSFGDHPRGLDASARSSGPTGVRASTSSPFSPRLN